MRMSELLMKWAVEHYAIGGHWIVDTMSISDIDTRFHNFSDMEIWIELMKSQAKKSLEFDELARMTRMRDRWEMDQYCY